MRSIWAVAANTIKQALRMRIAVVFIILLLILLPVMGLITTGDGTLKGRLQTYTSYGMSLTSLLLCLLSIIVSVYTLTSDFDGKQIYTVLTKPLHRFQFLVGKLIGVMILNIALLILFSAIIYAVVVFTPGFSKAPEDELEQAKNEFFTARTGLRPAEIDVSQEVKAAYEKLQRTGQLEQIFENVPKQTIMAQLTAQKKQEKQSAVVGRELVWEFEKVKPLDSSRSLFIRFKYDVSVNPPDLSVYSRWEAGDIRQIKDGSTITPPFYRTDRKDLIRTFHEIEVPADVVAADGYLAIIFLNVPLNRTVVMFPPEDGLEILYKADTFTANFLRAVLLILSRLIFLTCLGILAATFLSFPVAILLCLAVFLTGTISVFIVESFDYLSKDLIGIYQILLRPIIQLLPQFDKANPSKYLVPARLLSWLALARIAVSMVLVKSGLLFAAGILIFSRRELARITV